MNPRARLQALRVSAALMLTLFLAACAGEAAPF